VVGVVVYVDEVGVDVGAWRWFWFWCWLCRGEFRVEWDEFAIVVAIAGL